MSAARRPASLWLRPAPAVVLAIVPAAAPALVAAGIFFWISLRRIAYPYDLEWMEGGMLCHALRLSEGLPIYAPPSVDFIPHLYTPLYPALCAALGKLSLGVGYLPARLISLLSLCGALAVGVALAARAGGSRALALCAAALPLAAFPLTGGFYDLARSDSLQLFLATAGAALAWRGRGSHGAALGAAVLLVAGFFAKQTAAPIIAATGAALLLQRRRPVLTLAAAGCGLFALTVYLLDRWSGGWFWTYIFRLHQAHAFFARRAYVETPLVLLKALGPALLLVPWALVRGRRGADLWFLCWLGLVGIFASCLAFGTQWAHTNAYIPGVFFPALAIGAAAGQVAEGKPFERAAAGALLGLSLVSLVYQGYYQVRGAGPSSHVPTAADRAAGDALIARLRAAPGEVLIPFHPFYGHLAGKRTYLHRMGVWDVRGTVAGPVRGLEEAIAAQRFSLIVFDDKVEWTWGDWPGVLQRYRVVDRFVGPRVVEGARTVPSIALAPAPPPAGPPGSGLPIDQELQ